ncbi:MAG TPA: tryptophan--tRNA ligase, partial [Mycobacteriales bacterium]|nr:tryptophan--tRNA ligase [Mycobacteriales bacterium]
MSRVLSGIQPTADSFHLGNYVGAVRQWVGLQEGYQAFYFIADLHAITVEYDPAALRRRTHVAAAQLLAAGIDPDRATVFVQSQVPAHAELAWVLGCITGYGEAGRMTQFKDKAAKQGNPTVGLFTYPILQAADILAYQASEVPVGEDQRQHLELSRNMAERFNARYGRTFTVPDAMIPEVGGRVMDLQEPTKKMSTTGGTAQGTVGVLDPPETIRKKFRIAVTDSGTEVRHDLKEKAGISNLIEILSIMGGDEIPAIEARYDGGGYGAFKQDVGDAVVAVLDPIRARYEELRADEAQLHALLARSAEKAR